MTTNGKQRSLFIHSDEKTKISEFLQRDLKTDYTVYGLSEPYYEQFREKQCNDVFKKYVETTNDTLCKNNAIDLFCWNNDRLGAIDFQFDLPRLSKPNLSQVPDFTVRALTRARSFIQWCLGPLDEVEWFESCSQSHGVTLGLRYSDTSLEAKNTFPLSTTSRALPLFDRYLKFNKLFDTALEEFNKMSTLPKYEIVEGSRLTTVPKTSSIDRTIAIEPTVNMFLQQGLMKIMYNRLEKIGLNLSTLPNTHHELAFVGSIISNISTIDFSSASDSVSIGLSKLLLPPDWFMVLDMVRTESCTLPDSSMLKLNMLSTMGNATTFPIETLIFASLIYGCSTDTNSLCPSWTDKNCSVFGDDCILGTFQAPIFIGLAEKVGFIVNKDKTFINDDGFRESCGHDYLRGRNIRCVYVRAPGDIRKSTIESWSYNVYNSFSEKYISCFGELNYVYKDALHEWLIDMSRRYDFKIKIVPSYFPSDSGIQTDDIRLIRRLSDHMAPLFVNKHGQIKFQFKRFIYKERERRDDFLHYDVALQRGSTEEPSLFSVRKRKGGYVVASGLQTWMEKPNTLN